MRTYKYPRVVVAVIVRNNNKLLLVKEKLEDLKDHWIIPGGGVEFGERITDAAKREILEETGINIKVKGVMGYKEIIVTKYGYHTVLFFVDSESKDHPSSLEKKILDAKYFDRDEIRKLDLVDSARWFFESEFADGL
jgi:ADP-ribose pyrophosphatase YjhB (NUDIX family)